MSKTANIHGTYEGTLTLVLPDCQRHLTRLRPGHPAAQHTSNLIQQLGNYERNKDVMRGKILISVQRIEEARA